MKRALVESPYSGTPEQIIQHTRYAHAVMLDCLRREESPYFSHLLLTQVLDDSNEADRRLGMRAGFMWLMVADIVIVAGDLGISSGMQIGIDIAKGWGKPIEYRNIQNWEALVPSYEAVVQQKKEAAILSREAVPQNEIDEMIRRTANGLTDSYSSSPIFKG